MTAVIHERAEIELPPRLPLGLREQPRRLARIELVAVVGLRGLIDVVRSLHGALPPIAL